MSSMIYLASASPRRHQLLLQIGVEHEVIDVPSPPGEDEPRHSGETPLDYVQRTAKDKAHRAKIWLNAQDQQSYDCNRPVLTADTTVALGDDVLGKPIDANDASRILSSLSDCEHIVYTAIVLSTANREWTALSKSIVTFGKLSAQDISDYIATGEPFGKAGAYGVQGYAAKFIQKIEGSYSGIMGLPLYETAQLLKNL